MPISRREFSAALAALPLYGQEPGAAPDKHALSEAALAAAKRLGASYADIRINRYRCEVVATRERQVQFVRRSEDSGAGVRVLVKGAWGFAATPRLTPEEVGRVTNQAVEIARANAAYQKRRIELAPADRARTTWKGAFERDPFEVPLDSKIQTLLKMNETALAVKGVSFVQSSMTFVNEQKFFASTDGSAIEQYLVRSYPQINVTAVDREKGDFQQRRSLPGPQSIGYEYLDQYPWIEEAERAGHEAVEKLHARRVEPGKYDLVLDPTHLWLTIHESVGHSTELDRALGWEANYAGTSFLTPEQAGKFRFGSKIVNFFADRTQPHGLATVAYDDDGVPAQRWYLVREGIFRDWQTTRELAPLIGRKSSYGCAHAQSWEDVPFARMPNVSLEPVKENVPLEALLAGVRRGIFIQGDGSFSIDQQRYNFQFGGQVFWEIRDGKRAGMLRDVAYQSRTPDFWGSCDALGGEATYRLGGAMNDGKGEPGQANAVSHGCPATRFRQVNVLNTAADRR